MRPFIGWDGEGINTRGPGKPQAYVLFGASTGDFVERRDGGSLTFSECADLIIRVGKANPDAWHVGFGFDYDVNQIIRSLPFAYLERLNSDGQCKYGRYQIIWHKGKSFTISETIDDVRTSVTIYDVFSFFACSFVKALGSIVSDDLSLCERVEFVSHGKQRRKEFTLDELDKEIVPYWREELALLEILVTRFRDLLYRAGFPITKWYGPGAIASHVLSQYNTRDHMAVAPDEVIEAAQYAYAGGRFELYRVGKQLGPIWAIDINSAYPDALSRLPSLSGGVWVHHKIAKPATEISYKDIEPFAVYRVSLNHPKWRQPNWPQTPPSPLFLRSSDGEMKYPWLVDGWYWSPEIENLCYREVAPYVMIHEVWVFIPDNDTKPFSFIRDDLYPRRQQWKSEGRPEQMALKLAMNSIYGKLAQRIGWEQKGDAPTYHQLEWAGWTTSYVRAHLWRTLWQLGDSIISVETDGIYCSRDPAELDIFDSKELGGWSVTKYNGIIYLQSGMYFADVGDQWKAKYRGFDPESLDADSAIKYLESIKTTYNTDWPELSGHTTRYIGLAAAMMRARGNPIEFRKLHGVWLQNHPRDLFPGKGKRTHYPDTCVECTKGIPPTEAAHYMGISLGNRNSDNQSTKHYLPWRDKKEAKWRKEKEYQQGLLFE